MSAPHGGQRPVLLCLPHAGGSAAFFRPWHTKLARVADVVPIEIAGHGARRSEPLPVTFETALASVWPAVRDRTTGRYALFGHSLGALYAFELARRLAPPPLALIVSGRNTPARSSEMPQCHELPDTAFADRLASYGGIPIEIYRDTELMRLFLPVLRADMRIAECYRRPAGPSLRCTIIAFYGEQDPLVSPDGAAGWRSETTGGCEIVSVPGGHFCLGEDVFTGRLAASLARATR
jgi:medium-chain acyl-[acyl-carrier-protein] hydrolase